MKPLRVLIAVVLFVGLALPLSTTVGSDGELAPWPYNSISPVELHKFLAEGKAEGMERTALLAALYGEAPSAQDDFDATYYILDLRIDETEAMLYGRVTMRARALSDGFAQSVLDFADGMDVDTVYEDDVAIATWSHAGNLITVDLTSPRMTGEEFELTIVYHGYPQAGGLQGFYFGSHEGIPVISTLSEPYQARSWWPCKDRPDDKADSVDIIVEVNSDFFVSSNGLLRDSVDHGATTTYYWHEEYPITTYLVSLAVTNYSHFREWYTYGPADADSMPVDFYCYPELLSEALTYWSVTPEIIDFFAETYGEYPFVNEKYGMTHFTWGGAMEHQTNTSATSGPFGFDLFLVAHELAHQWWGDYITIENWHHIWLNEGFATYSEALYAEELGGADFLHLYMEYLQYWWGGTIWVQDISSPYNILDIRVYDKGAWVLHMLRGVVGDEAFFDILRAYYNDPSVAHGDATTEEFRDIAEAVSGRDLDTFFDQWIYDEYYPLYRHGYVQDPATDDVHGYVTQFQAERGLRPVFEMPIRLKFEFAAGGDTLVVLENNQIDQTFHFDFSEPVTSMTFDADNWILDSAFEQSGILMARTDYTVVDDTGNDNGRPDPGESDVQLIIAYTNLGVDVSDLTMHVATEYPEIVFTNDTYSAGGVAHFGTFDNSAGPFVCSIDADFPPTIVDFVIEFSAYGGSLTYTDTLRMNVGQPQVMLVDDDGGTEKNYEHYVTVILDALRLPYVVWGKDTLQSPPADTLATFPTVLWLTGDSRPEMLTPGDVAGLQEYLDGGGRLFLTGQDIVQNLDKTADSMFVRDYLHARYVPGNPLILAEGVPGDPIGDGHAIPLGGPGGASNQNSPDILSPVSAHAKPIYTYYGSTDIAGLRARCDDYRVVVFGFGIEAIADDLMGYTKRSEVFTRVYDWLTMTEGAFVPGDLDDDGEVTPVDVVYMVQCIFQQNPGVPVCDGMDVDANCRVNPVDVVIMVNYVYRTLGELLPGCVE